MPHSVHANLIAEDFAHEAFVRAIAARVAREENIQLELATVSSSGGSGKAIMQLRGYVQALRVTAGASSLLIVLIDANCKGWHTCHSQISGAIDPALVSHVSIGCPDPHVEKWYLADRVSLQTLFGQTPKLPRMKCARDVYKNALINYLISSGNVVTLGGAEFAEEIVGTMDLYRACKADRSLRAFVDSLLCNLRLARS